MTITNQMLHLSQGEFWVFLGLSVGVAAAGFWYAFRNLLRARTIEDTPTAKIRSAQQGYVELTGQTKSMNGDATKAPLTGIGCCCTPYRVDDQRAVAHRHLHACLLEDVYPARRQAQ